MNVSIKDMVDNVCNYVCTDEEIKTQKEVVGNVSYMIGYLSGILSSCLGLSEADTNALVAKACECETIDDVICGASYGICKVKGIAWK